MFVKEMATTEVQAALDADAELSKPMQIADSVFALTLSDDVVSSSEKADIQKQLMEDISARAMTPFYIKLCDKLGWTKDEALIAKLTAENEKELKDLDAKIEDATANLGQNEVMDFVIEKANMFARIGEHQDKVAEAYTEIPEKSSSKGQKIDVVLHLIRVAFFHNDLPSVKKHLENAKRLVEGGGDWDRRNRLKVYEATYLMTMREFAKAADLLLDSIATFTSLEMFSYRDLIFYTVMMSVFSLDRVALKAKVIDSPDVLSLILEIPHLSEYLNALQDCQYRGFFQAMADMHPSIMRNRYLSKQIGRAHV